MSARLVLRSGPQAARELGSPAFLEAWRDLAARCPWSTVFQRPSFVGAWYETYAARYEPVLVLAYGEGGALEGFLPLARSVDEPGGLVAAGANQAEYQAWICSPAEAGRFFARALAELGCAFGSRPLAFRYLPECFPVSLLAEEPLVRDRADVRAVPRPILDLASPEAAAPPSKQTKNKLNRLRKHGEVRFERITDRERFEEVLAEAMPLCDLRQGAVHDSMPFRQDDLKEAFHRALFERGDVLHVTALFAGTRPVSIQINTYDEHSVYLGISAYSPFFAHASPGRLHIVLLPPLLAGEGFRRLDLTPGGDQYKERFAGAHDEVHELTVYAGRAERDRVRARRSFAGAVKAALGSVGIRRASLGGSLPEPVLGASAVLPGGEEGSGRYAFFSSAREEEGAASPPHAATDSTPGSMGPAPRRAAEATGKEMLGSAPPSASAGPGGDAVAALLECAYRLPRSARRPFLSESLARLERDELLLTFGDGRGGRYWAWFNPAPAEAGIGWGGKALSFPEGTGCLYDLGVIAAPAPAGPPVEALRGILAQCRALSGLRDIYIIAPEGGPWAAAASEAGLRRLGELEKPRCGGSRRP